MSQPIRACSVCWGSGLTMDNKPCFCGCRPHIVSSKPEDYGLPSYQQLQERIATLTRQRDLAVEALQFYMDHGICEATYHKVREALSTIKSDATAPR